MLRHYKTKLLSKKAGWREEQGRSSAGGSHTRVFFSFFSLLLFSSAAELALRLTSSVNGDVNAVTAIQEKSKRRGVGWGWGGGF